MDTSNEPTYTTIMKSDWLQKPQWVHAMNAFAFMRVAYFILAIALLTGCKRTPSIFAHRIAGTDRIVVKFASPSLPTESKDFSVVFSGNKVQEIVKAVSFAIQDNETNTAGSWEMRFYNGTNRLATANLCGDHLIVENHEYNDKSGVLSQLYRDVSFQMISKYPEVDYLRSRSHIP